MTFKISKTANAGGTRSLAKIESSFPVLESVLGPPTDGDNKSISTEWLLEDIYGNVVRVCDWQATDLFDNSLPSVEAFRCIPVYGWSVAAIDINTVRVFVEWLSSTISAHKERKHYDEFDNLFEYQD